ncbi:type II secretion system protein J [Thermodesulfobacteriota bacterium]
MKAFYRPRNADGFTLIEMLVASIILAFVAAGVWGVYWSIINIYQVEQRDDQLQAEGERILDLIRNGGYFGGRKIHGLRSMSAVSGYPLVGQRTVASPVFDNDADDYRIEFLVDDPGSGNPKYRYGEFSVEFSASDQPTSKFYFKLRTEGIPGFPNDHNYDVLITQNMLQRKSGTAAGDYGNYDKTWFKAQKLSSVTGYCSGVKASFYLVDLEGNLKYGLTPNLIYNYRLDRKEENTMGNPEQRKIFLGGVPYPKYFSTSVYLNNRSLDSL